MRIIVACLTVGFLLLATREGRSQMSVGDLFRYCTTGDETLSQVCGVYMTGFMNGLNYEQITRGNGPEKICLPKDITGQNVKDVFEGFMRDYPKLQIAPEITQPSIIVGMALFRAYPCPKAPQSRAPQPKLPQ